METSFIIENDKEFKKLLDEAGKKVSDFRIPFTSIKKDFYRSNRKIFTLKTKGLYDDFGGFSPDTKDQVRKGRLVTRRVAYKYDKQRAVGFVYPMLFREGALAESMLNSRGRGAVNFVGRRELVLGTSIKHAVYHQSDETRSKIPQRKFLFIDGGEKEVARDAKIAGRRERWFNIVRDHVKQVVEGEI